MICDAHILTLNEAEIIPFTIRHYKTFCSRITVHDLGSKDGTQEIARKAGCDVVQHDCSQEFDDRLNKKIKNECWRGTSPDWSICADADELIYFPSGAQITLNSYTSQGIPIVKPLGFEMTSDVFPVGEGQIYEYVKHGGRDDFWYGKPIMFSPKQITSIDFGTGAHQATAILKNGRPFHVEQKAPATAPACYLLHFHHVWPIEKIAERYDGVRARMSAINKQMKWGLQEPGLDHAKKKRAAILSNLERVIP